jgi:hypothetical protein
MLLLCDATLIPAKGNGQWGGRETHPRRAQWQASGRPSKGRSCDLCDVGQSNPPAHFFLGTVALSFVTTKIDTLQAEIGRWTHVTTSTDATHSGHWVGRGERRPTQNACKH